MSIINLQNVRQSEGLVDSLNTLKTQVERKVNLEKYSDKDWNWYGINMNRFIKEKELFEIRQKQKFVQDHLFESFAKKAFHPDRIQRILNELEEEDLDRDNIEYMDEYLL